jgi:hypothetical protein
MNENKGVCIYIRSTCNGMEGMSALRLNLGSSWRGVVKLNTLATLLLGKEPLALIEWELFLFLLLSGPRAYAPDAPQPVGPLCYPSVLDVPTFAASPRDP